MSMNTRIFCKHSEQSDDWITCEHIRTFGSWLQTHLMGNNIVGDELYSLARTTSTTVLTYQGYEINGNTFYTIAPDEKSTNQNSGVRFDAATKRGKAHIMVTEWTYGNLTMDMILRSVCFGANWSICQEAGYR